MFPDNLPLAPYYEERAAAEEAARRMAQEQTRPAETAQVKAPVATKHAAPSSLAQTLQPPLSRVSSSGVLGSIFQGFKRAGTATPSPTVSAAPSRAQTPVMKSCADRAAELEAMKRDADICALPGWH